MKIMMSCGSHGHAHKVENASKRYCGRESIDAFSMKTKTQTFENESKRTGYECYCVFIGLKTKKIPFSSSVGDVQRA